MFGPGEQIVTSFFKFPALKYTPMRRWVILSFSVIVLIRMALMMFRFLKRRIPWTEILAVPTAYAIYYVGFSLLVLPNNAELDVIDMGAIALFFFGSYLNTASELSRDRFKRKSQNKGRLYTEGLISRSMHINFFGDMFWVLAYAIITRHPWGFSFLWPFLFFFAFYNVPLLDTYLAEKYGEDFKDYAKKTKRLIPYIWWPLSVIETPCLAKRLEFVLSAKRLLDFKE